MSNTVPVSQSRKQPGGDGRCRPPKIEIVTRDEHSVGTRIFIYVESIGSSVRVTVVRIQLLPRSAGLVPMVDVIADHHYAAAIPYGALVEVCFVHPILIEGQRLGYSHRVYASAGGS